MNSALISQALASFIVGGIAVALLSLFAERLPKQIAGIVLMLPSTFAISLLFLGLTVSPDVVSTFLPVLPISLGASFLFAAIYIHSAAALFAFHKVVAIFLSFIAGSAAWALLSIPLVLYSFTNTVLSILGFAIVLGIAHKLIRTRVPSCKAVDTSFTHGELFVRSLVAGSLISFVVILGAVAGPLWGGLFSVFPAATASSLTMIHLRHNSQVLFHVCYNICYSGPQFIIYAFVAARAFPEFGVWIGSILAYLSAILYCIAVHMSLNLQKKL